jgi:hypothetical protein
MATGQVPTMRQDARPGRIHCPSLQLNLLKNHTRQKQVETASGPELNATTSRQPAPRTQQRLLDDLSHNDHDNVTNRRSSQCEHSNLHSADVQRAWPLEAASSQGIMCSMNGGLTFRHMLQDDVVEPTSQLSSVARNSSSSTDTDTGHVQTAMHETDPALGCNAVPLSAFGACSKSLSLSPGEPQLTFRVMLPATPEENSCEHSKRSGPAADEPEPDGSQLSPVSSLGSDLTDPNSLTSMGTAPAGCVHKNSMQFAGWRSESEFQQNHVNGTH